MSVGAVIPNLNYGHFLGDALASLRRQTLPIKDVVIVDAGSTDDSKAVADRYGVRWMTAPPGSIGQARNIGIASLETDYILPLDSDDWVDDTYAEKCVIPMSDPTVGAVGTGLVYQPSGNVQWPDEPLTADRLRTANRMFTCSLIRKTAWESVGGYDEYQHTYEDWELWLNLAIHNWRLVVVPEPLFNHRLHSTSHTQTVSRGVRHPQYVEYIMKKHLPHAVKEIHAS